MTRKLLIAPILALGLASVPALGQSAETFAEAPAEARIHFANSGGIRDWRPGVERDAIYVQDRHRRWYKATLMGAPVGLRTALAIGFDTGSIDTFDRFSTVVVEGWRYPVQSLVRVDGPPPRRARRPDKA